MNKLPERIRIKDIARLADVSVGTVDRVIHGRSGVSEASKKRVEEILKQLDYQPNMYASALASNKKYTFICLLPQHLEGEYWTAVELGIHEAIATYSDFNTSVKINYYDPYDYHSFVDASEAILRHIRLRHWLLHSLWQRKNQLMTKGMTGNYKSFRYSKMYYVIVCSVTRSAYVAQARFACQYHISVFRQSQAPTVLYFFR